MKLEGSIDAHRVAVWWRSRDSLFAQHKLDLQSVTTVDSSGVAFLVHWAKHCRANGRTLQLQGASQQLIGMLMLYAVEPLFELAPIHPLNESNN